MHRRDVPIITPCGADWSAMSPVEARKRLCADCNKHVHDISKMSEGEVRALVAGGPACVRYLYDVHGNVIFGDAPANARVVPASSLVSKVARSKWLAAAAIAATPLLFEACGGGPGGFGGPDTNEPDARAPEPPPPPASTEHTPANPHVDAGEDADAGVEDASTD